MVINCNFDELELRVIVKFFKIALVTWGKCNQGFLSNVRGEKFYGVYLVKKSPKNS